MIYYIKNLFGKRPKLTAAHKHSKTSQKNNAYVEVVLHYFLNTTVKIFSTSITPSGQRILFDRKLPDTWRVAIL